MGKADVLTKQYMQNAEVFADAFNYYVYGGEQVIKPEQLHELDTAAMAELYGKGKGSAPVLLFRDLLKYVTAKEDGEFAYLILGVENQQAIHYAMPVRNLLYDAMQYYQQVQDTTKRHRKTRTQEKQTREEFLSGFRKTDKLLPVITLVVYFGTEPWDAPRSIHEMLTVKDARALSCVADYKINLLEPGTMPDTEIEKLKTDLKSVFLYIKYAQDHKKLQELMEKEDDFRHMRRATAEMLNTVTNSKIELSEGEEEIDMCKAIQDMRDEAIAIGIAEGKAKGKAEGKAIGEARGIVIGELKMLFGLVKDGLLTAAQASSRVNLTEEQFIEKMTLAGFTPT